jgi:hypothetical protein
MIKTSYFDNFDEAGWPTVAQLQPFFLAPTGKEWSYQGGNDCWGLDVQGLYGTAGLPRNERVNVHLYMIGHPAHGVLLQYNKWDGRIRQMLGYCSKGDVSRIREHVRSAHGSLLPVGLFIPFRTAWKAVREFIETDGELPKSIEWVADRDIPPEAFPDPPRPSSVRRAIKP